VQEQVLSRLAESAQQDPAQLERHPLQWRQRIWEVQPLLIMPKLQPLVAEFVQGMRRRLGPLFIELKKKTPSARRAEDSTLQQLEQLVGPRAGLYRNLRQQLKCWYDEALESDSPALRFGRSSSTSSPARPGRPISVGPEPFLST
ncbi:unnamed protein product, partial [Polarella glacialis]